MLLTGASYTEVGPPATPLLQHAGLTVLLRDPPSRQTDLRLGTMAPAQPAAELCTWEASRGPASCPHSRP